MSTPFYELTTFFSITNPMHHDIMNDGEVTSLDTTGICDEVGMHAKTEDSVS